MNFRCGPGDSGTTEDNFSKGVLNVEDGVRLKEFVLSDLDQLTALYRRNYPADYLKIFGLEADYLQQIVCSKEFLFGWMVECGKEPVGFIIFTKRRDGVISPDYTVIDKDYPLIFAGTIRSLMAALVSKLRAYKIRKVEIEVEQWNSIALKYSAASGSHKYSENAQLVFFENYFPSLLCLSKLTASGKTPLLDVERDFLQLLNSYRRSITFGELDGKICLFYHGQTFSFGIDRIAEGCSSIEIEDNFNCSSRFSNAFPVTGEHIDLLLSMENLSPQNIEFNASSYVNEIQLLERKKVRVRPGAKEIIELRITDPRPGYNKAFTILTLADKEIEIHSACFLREGVQLRHGEATYIFSPRTMCTLPIKIQNRLNNHMFYRIEGRNHGDLQFTEPKGLLELEPKAQTTMVASIMSPREDLFEIKEEVLRNPNDVLAFSERTFYARISFRKNRCIANMFDRRLVMENGNIRLLFDLRTGVTYVEPVGSDLFKFFQFWDEIGPPFSEFPWPERSADPVTLSEDCFGSDQIEIPVINCFSGGRSWKAVIVKNGSERVHAQISEKGDDRLRKDIVLHDDSVIEFNTSVAEGGEYRLDDQKLQIKTCYVCKDDFLCTTPIARGVNTYLELELKNSPYKPAGHFSKTKKIFRNYVSFNRNQEGNNYVFGLMWEEKPDEIDYINHWHKKMPWLIFPLSQDSTRNYRPIRILFYAGQGTWRKIMSLKKRMNVSHMNG